MKAHRAEHRVVTMSRVLRLSKSGYYAWLGRKPSARAVRSAELLAAIKAEHLDSHGIYGAPRILEKLRRRQLKTSRKRVARLMRVHAPVWSIGRWTPRRGANTTGGGMRRMGRESRQKQH